MAYDLSLTRNFRPEHFNTKEGRQAVLKQLNKHAAIADKHGNSSGVSRQHRKALDGFMDKLQRYVKGGLTQDEKQGLANSMNDLQNLALDSSFVRQYGADANPNFYGKGVAKRPTLGNQIAQSQP